MTITGPTATPPHLHAGNGSDDSLLSFLLGTEVSHSAAHQLWGKGRGRRKEGRGRGRKGRERGKEGRGELKNN